MSHDFVSLKNIRASDMFDGRLEKFNICEHINENTNENHKCLFDGRNYLWACIDDDGFVGCITNYGGNNPGKILGSIRDAFDTNVVSELDPRFWGFDTDEEWEACMEELNKQADEKFYIRLMKHLRGEPRIFTPGTVGMTQAHIAEGLVAMNSELLLLENKDRLLKVIDEIYHHYHVAKIELSETLMKRIKSFYADEEKTSS